MPDDQQPRKTASPLVAFARAATWAILGAATGLIPSLVCLVLWLGDVGVEPSPMGWLHPAAWLEALVWLVVLSFVGPIIGASTFLWLFNHPAGGKGPR
jgi:hypothetical protein